MLYEVITDNDYNIKMRSVRRFLEEGDKVKVTLRFRGRDADLYAAEYDAIGRSGDGRFVCGRDARQWPFTTGQHLV